MNQAGNHLPQDPTNRGSNGPQNLEAMLRGMLKSDQVINQIPMQPTQPMQPAPGQYAQLPMTSAPPPGLLPSPSIHRQQQHPPPMLQRSSTVPSHGFAPRHHPPNLDRAGTFHDGMPSPLNGPASYQSPRSRGGGAGGGRWGRSNEYQIAPMPQINNTLHFPPLGTVPTQPPPLPLSEHRFPSNMNNDRRYSGMGCMLLSN